MIIRFLKSKKGDISFLTPFIVCIVLVVVIILVMSYGTYHTIYQQAQDTIERSASISAVVTEENKNIRDIIYDIPKDFGKAEFENKLRSQGLTKVGTAWQQKNGDKISYELSGILVNIDGEYIVVNADITIYLYWVFNGKLKTTPISIETRSRILYLMN